MTREPTPPSIGYLVWHLSLRWQAELNRALAPVGLTHTEYAVLASLHGLTASSGEPPSQRQLADFSGLEPMYVSKLVRSLERDGLVERARDRTDPRAMRCSLTRRGREAVETARPIVVRLEQERLGILGGPGSTRSAQLWRSLETLLHQARNDGERDQQ